MSELTQEDYSLNIKKVYVFVFFWMFLVLIPVIVPYFLDLGLTMEQVFQLQAVFSLTIALFEVPSGYFCDLWGRKTALVFGSFLSASSFTWLCFIETFEQLLVFEVVIGIAASLVSGADLAILYDSLKFKKADRQETTNTMANNQMAFVTGESVGSILGGLLVKISFTAVLIGHAFTSWLAFFVALFIKEPPIERMDRKSHWSNFKEILHLIFRKDKLVCLVFVNQVLWGLSTFIAVWIFQKYWQEGNIPLYAFGFLWAGYNLLVGIVGKRVSHWERKYGAPTLLLAIAFLPIVGYFGMAMTLGWVGVLFGLCFQISRGINQVILNDALNWRIPSESRATVNSFSSLFFRLSFCMVGPAVGYSIDAYGLTVSLQTIGTVFFVMIFLVLAPLLKEVRKLKPA